MIGRRCSSMATAGVLRRVVGGLRPLPMIAALPRCCKASASWSLPTAWAVSFTTAPCISSTDTDAWPASSIPMCLRSFLHRRYARPHHEYPLAVHSLVVACNVAVARHARTRYGRAHDGAGAHADWARLAASRGCSPVRVTLARRG